MEDETMRPLSEIARKLHLNRSKLSKMAREEKITAVKINNQWYANESTIMNELIKYHAKRIVLRFLSAIDKNTFRLKYFPAFISILPNFFLAFFSITT